MKEEKIYLVYPDAMDPKVPEAAFLSKADAERFSGYKKQTDCYGKMELFR